MQIESHLDSTLLNNVHRQAGINSALRMQLRVDQAASQTEKDRLMQEVEVYKARTVRLEQEKTVLQQQRDDSCRSGVGHAAECSSESARQHRRALQPSSALHIMI